MSLFAGSLLVLFIYLQAWRTLQVAVNTIDVCSVTEHYPAGNFNLKVDRLYLAIKGQSEGTHLCEFVCKLCSFDIKRLSFARKTFPVSLHCQHQLKTQEESVDFCCLCLILTLVFALTWWKLGLIRPGHVFPILTHLFLLIWLL